MFNLVMLSGGWEESRKSMQSSRLFEYTDDHISGLFKDDASANTFTRLTRLPCLFMEEGTGEEVARVGYINRVDRVGINLVIEYQLDNDVPALFNSLIYANRTALHMQHEFEFSRNHWAVKDVDLYRFLLRTVRPRRQRPRVFEIPEHERVEKKLASAMMPFDAGFASVYKAIQEAAEIVDMKCRRADDIWENPEIIQDVVSLIDRSRIVVCDCTGRNPNVFYEAGIAHTLGREVILLTQSEYDIPFDLRHLRYVKYLNNSEGLEKLIQTLSARMATLVGH